MRRSGPAPAALDQPDGANSQSQCAIKSKIVFIGEFLFPEGDAAAVRTLSLARLCRDLGFRVTVIGKGRVRAEDYNPDMDGYYIDGIRYTTMNPEPVSMLHRFRHPLRRLRQFVSALEALDMEETRAVIINACDSARHVPFVSAFCQRKSIPLIGDVCEWYDPCQIRYGRLNPSYAVFCIIFRYFFPRLRNLIVVSKLLESHFKGAERHVARVAAPLDVSTIPCIDRTPTDRLVLLYAGSAGRKDLLAELIVALASLSRAESSRIEFRLLGPTKQQLMKLLGKSAGLLNLLGDTVKPLGPVPRHRVLDELQKAHFTVLLRPHKRYANAGFPSKVAESLAAGAPVLLNLTSDLGEYLGDGIAALPFSDCSPMEVAKVIRRALELTPAERRDLRRCARAKAEQYFDYRLYLGSFRSYLDQLHSG